MTLFKPGRASVPGSDVRIPLQHALVRTSEPKGTLAAIWFSSVALDLTFLRRTRRNAGRNVKSATLVAAASITPGPGALNPNGEGADF
jgi:hypothetical protein